MDILRQAMGRAKPGLLPRLEEKKESGCFNMGLWQRAYLYVRRKKRKSVLLFLTVFLLSAFSVTGLLLRSMADLAVVRTRESLKGAFRIAPDMQNRENIIVSEADGGTNIRYIGEPLNEKVAEAVQSTERVSDYNCVIKGNAMLREEISLIDYNGKYLEDPVAMHLISVEAHRCTLYAGDFQKQRLRLVKGEPIGADDSYAAVISEKLALQNHLEIGDEIRLSPCIGHAGQEIRVTVKGLFAVDEKQRDADAAAPGYLLENRIFIDIAGAGLLTAAAGADYMEFFVDDPAEVEKIMEEIRGMGDIPWEDFALIPEIDEYEKIVNPLTNTMVLLDTLLTVTAAMSVAVLALIQMLFQKSRGHETGILLSVGISGAEIILQHFTEMMIVAFGSFILSLGLCFSFWSGISRMIYQMAAFRVDLNLSIGLILRTTVMIFGCGSAVLFLAGLLSDLWLMRLGPKKIFAKLS